MLHMGAASPVNTAKTVRADHTVVDRHLQLGRIASGLYTFLIGAHHEAQTPRG